MALFFQYPAPTISIPGVAQEATLQSVDAHLANIETSTSSLDTKTIKSDTDNVNVTASVLPTGAATEVTLANVLTKVTSLDTKTTAVNTGAVTVAASALPTGAATEVTVAGVKTAIDAINTKIPASPSQDRTTAAAPSATRLSDGTAFYKATTPADTQPVSLAAVPLPTGASTEASLTSLISIENASGIRLSSLDTKSPNLGQALMANSVPMVIASNQTAFPVTTNGLTDTQLRATSVPVSGPLTDTQLRAAAVPVSGSFFPATQPVSGTVAVTQSTSPWVVDGSATTQPISAAALPLPTGASTSANQTSQQSSLTSIDGKTPALGQAAMVGSSPVVIASNQTAIPVTQLTGALTNRSGSTSGTVSTSTQIMAAVTTRRYLLIQNVSTTATIWVNFTSAATTTQPSFYLLPGGSYSAEGSFVTNEAINVISTVASVPYAAKEF